MEALLIGACSIFLKVSCEKEAFVKLTKVCRRCKVEFGVHNFPFIYMWYSLKSTISKGQKRFLRLRNLTKAIMTVEYALADPLMKQGLHFWWHTFDILNGSG